MLLWVHVCFVVCTYIVVQYMCMCISSAYLFTTLGIHRPVYRRFENMRA